MIEQVFANQAFIAGVFTILGGVFLKVAEKWIAKHGERRSDRQDFRAEIKELNDRIDRLEQEVTDWRTRYYREQEEVATLRMLLINNGMVPPERGTPAL